MSIHHPMLNVSSHPSPNELGNFLVGSLSHDRDAVVGQHVEECAACRGELDTICGGQDHFDSRLREIHSNSPIDLSFARNKPAITLEGFAANHGPTGHQGASIQSLDVIHDRYQLAGELCRGGMGMIVAGRDKLLDRELVFKVLPNSDDAHMVARFIAEAKICGNLQHPGIVPIYDLGRLVDNRPFFAMKRIEGHTLGELLRAREDFTSDQAKFLHILTQVSQTVAFAHSMQVIHRDLKPDNIMVGAFGEVQVMDWGIAKVLDEEEIDPVTDPSDGRSHADPVSQPKLEFGVTKLGRALGTPAYMSVEQAQGRIDDVDKRSDVFALGAILCEILTGKSPYWNSEHDVGQFLRRAERGDLSHAFRRLDACGIDVELVEFCKKCLAVDPEDRPSDASCVSAAVIDYAETVNQRLRQAELSQAIQRTRRTEQRKRRRIVMAAALTIVILATVLVGGYLGHRIQTIGHQYEVMQRVVSQQRLELMVAQEQDEFDRTLRLVGSYRGSNVKVMLEGFRQVSDVRSARSESDRLQQAAGMRLSPLDQEFVKRLLEAHIWCVANVDPELRRNCLTEAEHGYRSTFSVFVNWEAPGEFPVKTAAESVLDKNSVVREVVVDSLDDWFRIVTLMPDGDLILPNWLLNVARQLDQNPTRRKMRMARLQKNKLALQELSREDGLADELPATIYCIVAGLADLGADEPARVLLEHAREWYPDAFWLNGQILRAAADKASSIVSSELSSVWQPSVNSDPRHVLSLAHWNARAKRYANALQQYEWLVSSRLSSEGNAHDTNLMPVIQAWLELGQSYAPAMTRFMALRETLRDRVTRLRSPHDVRESFRMYAAISRVLGEDSTTAELFVRLDALDEASAREVFDLAQSSLLKDGRIELIQKYLEQDEAFTKFLSDYSGPGKSGDVRLNTVLTFIAFQVQNGYKQAALEIALDACRLWPDANSHTSIERALAGQLPHPSPEEHR
jgi:serine/threonine protein kinase